MLRNYFKIAWRNLVRNKMFSLINIFGLALAMTFSLIIFIWVLHETSFDRFHTKEDRIYQVKALHTDNRDNLVTGYETTGTLTRALINDVPEIQIATRIFDSRTGLIIKGDIKFYEKLAFTDSSFFGIFDFKFIAGSGKHALRSPYSVVITEEIAIKYFQRTDVAGEALHIKDYDLDDDFTISGVVENPPSNSSIQFDILLPFESVLPKNEWMSGWGSTFLKTYVLLNKNTDKETVEAKIKDIPVKYHTWDYKLFLHNLRDLYLYNEVKASKAGGEIVYNGDGLIRYIRLFGIVAIAVLILGCINFMNLSTAVAGKRAKEIGLRKMTGAKRSSLTVQFLSEAIFLAVISVSLSLLLVHFLLPAFNSIVGKSLHVPYGEPKFILTLILVPVATGLLAGSYPAFYLASFRPTHALKQIIFGRYGAENFRRGLVIFQMAVSVILIFSTIVVLLQLNFIRNKDLGVSRENVVYFELPRSIAENSNAFENAMNETPFVKSFSYTSENPLQVYPNTGDPKWEGMEENGGLNFHIMHCGWDFIKTVGMTMKEGRSFSREMRTDSFAVIINEEAVKMMGLKEPLGTRIEYWGREGQIVGVVKDFHYQPMQSRIDPLIIGFWPQNTSYAIAKMDGLATQRATEELQNIYESFEKDFPFEYHFLDQEYEKMYKNEAMLGKLANIFAFLAIFISCLGLYGLVAYTTKKKNKEISIRKVNGATIQSLLLLLTSSYVRWVIIANLIGWPVAWYMMTRWLEGYVYKIDIEWWIFGLVGAFIMVITFITVSFQTIKASMENPVEALRYG